MQGVTFLVRQVITVIVDDQLQLGAFWQPSRFVEVQPSVLDTCTQRRHVITVRPPTSGRQAGREDGHGRTPGNSTAYADKSNQELCKAGTKTLANVDEYGITPRNHASYRLVSQERLDLDPRLDPPSRRLP